MTVFPDIIIVDVTKEDIEKGKPRTFSECAVALAVKRLFPDCFVAVGPNVLISAFPGVVSARYEIAEDLRLFINLFDKDEDGSEYKRLKMAPQTFTLTRIYDNVTA